jgi:hypothetical protein
MTDYFWPTSLVPSASEWRLVANTAAFSSPLTGSTRTIARGGDRWACTLQFNNLTSSSRAILQAFLSQLRGQANRCYVRDHSYRKRGVFPTSNLMPALTDTGSWSKLFCTMTTTDGVARAVSTAHSAAQFGGIYATFTAILGGGYAMRAHYTRSNTGTASMGPAIDVGNTANNYSTAQGLKTTFAVCSSAGTSEGYALIDSTGSTMTTNDFADISYASLSRCMRVASGSQTGLGLAVDGTTASTDLLAGDLIEYNGELNMVADTLDGSTGAGTIRLVRPMRSSPAIYTPVIIHDPVCKMILANNTVGWSNQPGGFSSMSVEFVEDIAT